MMKMVSSTAFQMGFVLAAALVAVCLFGLFQQQISEINYNFFMLLLRPFFLINESLQSFWRGVRQFFHDQFSVDGQLDLQQVFFQFIGAVLYSIFFIAFNSSAPVSKTRRLPSKL